MVKNFLFVGLILLLLIGFGIFILTVDVPPTTLSNADGTISIKIATDDFLDNWYGLPVPEGDNRLWLAFSPNSKLERAADIAIGRGAAVNELELDAYARECKGLALVELLETYNIADDDDVAQAVQFNGLDAVRYEFDVTAIPDEPDVEAARYRVVLLVVRGEAYYATVLMRVDAEFADTLALPKLQKGLNGLRW